MPKRGGSSFWLLLLLVPPMVAAALIAPPFGTREEGWLAEIIGITLARSREFSAFAENLRFWAATVFTVAAVLGIIYWIALRKGWRRRLLTFDPQRVSGYRNFVFVKMLLSALFAAAFCIPLLFLARLQAMDVRGWIMLVAGCAILAALQFFVTVWAISDTRRLYRGH